MAGVFYYLYTGPDVPKTIIMNAVTNEPTFLLNNQTELAAKYASMAKPQSKIIQVRIAVARVLTHHAYNLCPNTFE